MHAGGLTLQYFCVSLTENKTRLLSASIQGLPEATSVSFSRSVLCCILREQV